MEYTEKQHVLIAKQEYEKGLRVGKPVIVGNNKLHIGTVTKIYDDRQTGLCAIVVKDSTVA